MTQKKVLEGLPDRLRKIRETVGKTQKEFAEILGVHFRAIQQYESGENVPGGTFLKALTKLGFNANWLLTGEGEMNGFEGVLRTFEQIVADTNEALGKLRIRLPESNIRLVHQKAFQDRYNRKKIEEFVQELYDLLPKATEETALPRVERPPVESPSTTETISLPMQNLAVSAGHGAFCDSEHVEMVGVPKILVDQLRVPIKSLCLVRTAGRSMEPTIRNDEVLFVDLRASGKPKADGIYVIRLNDALMVKRVQILPRGALELSSDSPGFKPILITPDDPPDDFAVLARVLAGFKFF